MQTIDELSGTIDIEADNIGFLAFCIHLQGVEYEFIILRSWISDAIQIVVKCHEHLLLLVELDIRLLTRCKHLANKSQQHGNDNYHDGSINDRISITIRIHSVPPYACTRLARRLIFT